MTLILRVMWKQQEEAPATIWLHERYTLQEIHELINTAIEGEVPLHLENNHGIPFEFPMAPDTWAMISRVAVAIAGGSDAA